MRYYKVLAFCVLLFFQCFISIDGFSQCNSKIDFKVESKGKGLEQIAIKSLDGAKDLKIQLYDLNLGKVVDETKMATNNTFQVAFKNMKPSLYMLYVWLPGCTKPQVIDGGKQGILIEN